MSTPNFDALHFGICRSILYHKYRQSFFQKLQSLFLFIALLSGTTSVAIMGEIILEGSSPFWKAAPSVVISILIGIMFVLRLNDKASLHGEIRLNFVKLQQEMEQGRFLQEDKMKEFLSKATTKRLEIESKEPRVLTVLDLTCHNEIMRSMGYPKDHSSYTSIGYFYRLLRQWFDINPNKLFTSGSTQKKTSV